MLASAACLAILFPLKWAPESLALARQDVVSNVARTILRAIRRSTFPGRMAVTEAIRLAPVLRPGVNNRSVGSQYGPIRTPLGAAGSDTKTWSRPGCELSTDKL